MWFTVTLWQCFWLIQYSTETNPLHNKLFEELPRLLHKLTMQSGSKIYIPNQLIGRCLDENKSDKLDLYLA